jgi:hypothetical protein
MSQSSRDEERDADVRPSGDGTYVGHFTFGVRAKLAILLVMIAMPWVVVLSIVVLVIQLK